MMKQLLRLGMVTMVAMMLVFLWVVVLPPAKASGESNAGIITNPANTTSMMAPTDFFSASLRAELSDHELEIGEILYVTVTVTDESVDCQFFNYELNLTEEGDEALIFAFNSPSTIGPGFPDVTAFSLTAQTHGSVYFQALALGEENCDGWTWVYIGDNTDVVTVNYVATPLDVVVSEVAWSGMPASANDEWIELYNNTGTDVDLTGWRLFTAGTPSITLTGMIPADGYFLLERTDDTSVPDRSADQLYTGALSNSPGEVITLTDGVQVVDIVGLDPGGEWFAGSSSPDRMPMERVVLTGTGTISSSWATGVISGTPVNSIVDGDGDTFGYSPNIDWLAGSGSGFETQDEDCNDDNADIYPGATEVLNYLDDNCDGQIDEGLDLGPFQWEAWFNSSDVIWAMDKSTMTVPMEAELIRRIDQANSQIDAAIYGFNLPNVAEALIAAHNRGVQVRIVGDDEAVTGYYSPTYQLVADAGISVVMDTSVSRIEHNKFAIFDHQVVWTGSTNWTDNGLTYNANNSIVITSTHLALAYTTEFEEMYTGTFQIYKADDTTHVFSFTNTIVEAYFSPTDGVEAEVTEILANAQESIHFGLFYFTQDAMADVVVSKILTDGLEVSGVWDAVGAKNPYSEDEKLCAAGVPLKVENFGGKVHHKFAVIDAFGDHPVVVTGSYNWTASGAEDNDENTLIIYDAAVAQAYYQEYLSLYNAIPDQAICSNHSAESGLAACQDGSDNDFDGMVDGADPGCREATPVACMDGVDNDNDGDVDLDDLDCFRCAPYEVGFIGLPAGEIGVGQTITLTAVVTLTEEIGPVSYAWVESGNTTADGDMAYFSWDAPGTYTVSVFVDSVCRSVQTSVELVISEDTVVETVYLPMVER